MSAFARFCIIYLSFFAPFSFAANTYYVAPTGSDNAPNDGSSNLPFREIRQALTKVAAGDTVLVADGQYLGFDVDSTNGSAASPITIQAQGAGAVVNVTTDRNDNRDTIFVTYSSYIVIDGLRSSNANRAAMRIDNSPHITARNCVFGNNATWGLFTDFCDDLLLENNECFGSVSQHGIYVSNSCTRPTVRGNRLHDNHANGLHMNGDLSQGPPGLITNALVENNVIYNNGLNGGGGSGINCDGVQNSVFLNNLIYAAHGAGITLYQTDAAAPSINATVVNNTIDVASDGKWAIQIHNGSSGATVFNNIFVTHHSFHGSIHLTVPADQTGLVCDYNILTTSNNVATPDDDNSYLTFAQWQALGFDLHSTRHTQDELFVNWNAGDYHLSTTSPALNIGVATLNSKSAPTSDLESHARPQGTGYDIGAYETVVSSGGTNSPPQIASGPSAAPNPAAPGQTVSFSVAASDPDGDALTFSWEFGDGSQAAGASPQHAYAAAGIFTVMVTVSDGSLTATGSVQVTVSGSNGGGGGGGGGGTPLVGTGPDSDGDGFSDGFETAAGTNPNDPASTPLNGQPATLAAIKPLTISKVSIKLNFAKTGFDSISFYGSVDVPAGFNAFGQKAPLDAGGVSQGFTLDSKGAARNGSASLKISIKFRRGAVPAQSAKFTASLKKGTFAATLAPLGLTGDATVRNAARSIVLTVIFNNTILQTNRPLSYSARKGLTGSAR
ncbi:MAG TPA: right-handed parallel beta-helix repeat-containing protein [Planctomycetota bacterium]|nr:right-handed parallel beta-helix repeat-containing protein [Planctomycetota bacterium]